LLELFKFSLKFTILFQFVIYFDLDVFPGVFPSLDIIYLFLTFLPYVSSINTLELLKVIIVALLILNINVVRLSIWEECL
jgi:hypothetical protein